MRQIGGGVIAATFIALGVPSVGSATAAEAFDPAGFYGGGSPGVGFDKNDFVVVRAKVSRSKLMHVNAGFSHSNCQVVGRRIDLYGRIAADPATGSYAYSNSKVAEIYSTRDEKILEGRVTVSLNSEIRGSMRGTITISGRKHCRISVPIELRSGEITSTTVPTADSSWFGLVGEAHERHPGAFVLSRGHLGNSAIAIRPPTTSCLSGGKRKNYWGGYEVRQIKIPILPAARVFNRAYTYKRKYQGGVRLRAEGKVKGSIGADGVLRGTFKEVSRITAPGRHKARCTTGQVPFVGVN